MPVEAKYGDESEGHPATGVPLSAKGKGAFQSITYGTFFRSESANECLLSLDMAKRIDEENPQGLIGKEFDVDARGPVPPASRARRPGGLPVSLPRVETPYGSSASLNAKPDRLAGAADGVGPDDSARPRAKRWPPPPGRLRRRWCPGRAPDGVYNTLVVKVKQAQFTQDVQDQIKKKGFSAFSLNDAMQGAKRSFLILDIVLSLIGSIALAVSSLGIMNTMVMSILERTREIGIMKAIGGSDGDIRRIFLIEASAIGFFGGVAGVALGWIVGRVINFGAKSTFRTRAERREICFLYRSG